MSNEVVVPETETALAVGTVVTALQAQSKYDDSMFGGISGSRASFFPRLQLFTSNSEQCKKGQIPVATYGIIKNKDELITLGKTVIGVPIAWRAKAMFVKTDPPLAYHNAKSPEFQDIKRKADADSNSGNLYGPEFLLWLGKDQGFVTFFMGSKTARNEAPSLRALLPGADGRFRYANFGSQYIETKEYSWHGPKIIASSQTLELPETAALETAVGDFLNPVDSVVEVAQTPANAPTDR
jgi:hypothetical protein